MPEEILTDQLADDESPATQAPAQAAPASADDFYRTMGEQLRERRQRLQETSKQLDPYMAKMQEHIAQIQEKIKQKEAESEQAKSVYDGLLRPDSQLEYLPKPTAKGLLMDALYNVNQLGLYQQRMRQGFGGDAPEPIQLQRLKLAQQMHAQRVKDAAVAEQGRRGEAAQLHQIMQESQAALSNALNMKKSYDLEDAKAGMTLAQLENKPVGGARTMQADTAAKLFGPKDSAGNPWVKGDTVQVWYNTFGKPILAYPADEKWAPSGGIDEATGAPVWVNKNNMSQQAIINGAKPASMFPYTRSSLHNIGNDVVPVQMTSGRVYGVGAKMASGTAVPPPPQKADSPTSQLDEMIDQLKGATGPDSTVKRSDLQKANPFLNTAMQPKIETQAGPGGVSVGKAVGWAPRALLTGNQLQTAKAQSGAYHITRERIDTLMENIDVLSKAWPALKTTMEVNANTHGSIKQRDLVNFAMRLLGQDTSYSKEKMTKVVSAYINLSEDINQIRRAFGGQGFRGEEAWNAMQSQIGNPSLDVTQSQDLLSNTQMAILSQLASVEQSIAKTNGKPFKMDKDTLRSYMRAAGWRSNQGKMNAAQMAKFKEAIQRSGWEGIE